jgi:hypothetical protein
LLDKEKMDIEFIGQHQRALYFRAVFLAYRPTLRLFTNRAILAVAIAALYIAYQVNLAPDRALPMVAPSRLMWHFVAAFVFLLVLSEPFLAPLYVAIRLWRDPSVHTVWKGRINALGITFADSGRTIRWDSFREAIRKPDVVILKTGSVGFLSLPRYFFKSEPDWQRVLRLAETKVHPLTPQGKTPGSRR